MKPPKQTRFIFITGGVVSSLGKGIAAASLGLLLKSRGKKVTIQKFDPYINVDPGTMNPYQHGEVYVTEDGAETDLDLGHYERFIDVSLSAKNSTSTGQVYSEVITKERKGEYLGSTVQVIPHITDEIKRRIYAVCSSHNDYDIVITEVGGTVGDIESLPFLEAIRQFCMELGSRRTMIIHLTLVPFIESTGELKTKPTQHSVMRLREIGLLPDLLLCRTEQPLNQALREKIGLFCNVSPNAVLEAREASTIYEVPLLLEKEHMADIVIKKLRIKCDKPSLNQWKEFVSKIHNPEGEITIGVCGKYTALHDAYKSIIESFVHAGVKNGVKVIIDWIDSEKITDGNAAEMLNGIHGLLIPGGFGHRGVEGKVRAVKYVRENNIPFFGICLGMQCAVIEFARNVCDLKKANSSEFNSKSKYPVIDLMPDQRHITTKGATMRLGAYPCVLKEGTLSHEAYGEIVIRERHRHRYEFNNDFIETLKSHGMEFAGMSPDEKLVEIIEVKDHPWFVSCQFHPELKSRAVRAHPLFREFIRAAKKYCEGINGKPFSELKEKVRETAEV
ncbi:CTP synthase [candidate division KSB1 bacterium]